MNTGGAKSKESTQHWLTGIYMSQEMRTQIYNWTAVELLNEEMLPCDISEHASANIMKKTQEVLLDIFFWTFKGRILIKYSFFNELDPPICPDIPLEENVQYMSLQPLCV